MTWIIAIAALAVALVLFAEFTILATTLLVVGVLVSTETVLGYVGAGLVVAGLVWLKTQSESA